ncbi:hypothetical protein CAEBREN_20424 [Caenorhabditis brenneri]|uniref:Uncharacterized protein n=1 Tax=Caenorhabditis brenneri TaxID=135651 RepID=G0MWL3_CAEBE|nr:hypothetical protein CAEBREN_20424 [Caenorhabditis brenneri]
MAALRKSRETMEEYDAEILNKCFYPSSSDNCETIARSVHAACFKEACDEMEKNALLRYCSRPMQYEEFCEELLGTATTTTIKTTTTTQTTKNPLMKTQYMVSYGAIGGVFMVLLIASLICWLCNRRSEKKRRKEEEEWKILGFGGGGTTSSEVSGSKKSDVEKGTTTKSKTGKTKTKKTKSTGSITG